MLEQLPVIVSSIYKCPYCGFKLEELDDPEATLKVSACNEECYKLLQDCQFGIGEIIPPTGFNFNERDEYEVLEIKIRRGKENKKNILLKLKNVKTQKEYFAEIDWVKK